MPTSVTTPIAIVAQDAPLRAKPAKPTNYPPVLAAHVAKREKRPLGDLFGLRNFGVNHTRLQPGAHSTLHHRHSRQDELIYVLAGTPTLVTDAGPTLLAPGMCAGFPAGGTAHHLENRTDQDVVYLELGDRTPGDEVTYPEDDVAVVLDSGTLRFTHKDGTPY